GALARRDYRNLLLADHAGDFGEQDVAVQSLDLDRHEEHGVLETLRPAHLDDSLLVLDQLRSVSAVRTVYRDSAALGDTAEDRISRHRCAAFRVLRGKVRLPLHENAGAVAAALLRGVRDPSRRVDGNLVGKHRGRVVLASELVHEQVNDVPGGDVVAADGGVQCVDVVVPQVGCQGTD